MTSGFVAAGDNAFEREISATIISDEALQVAQTAFEAYCAAAISALPGGKRQLLLTPHDEASGRQCVLSFWNFALTTEAELRLEGRDRG